MSPAIQSVVEIKNYNLKRIVGYLRTNSPATKKDIASHLGLSFATVSTMCNQLLEKGIVLETGLEETHAVAVGRLPKVLSLNKQARYLAVADFHRIGKVRLALYNLFLEQVHQIDFTYGPQMTLEQLIQCTKNQYEYGFAERMRQKVVGMSVAVSGIYDIHTETIVASELDLFECQPIKTMLSQALNVPVHIENESNLCVMATTNVSHKKDIIYIYLSEGVGVGILSGGRQVLGRNGYGSEICHIPLGKLSKNCRICGCPRCVQTDLSLYGFSEKFIGRAFPAGDMAGWEMFMEKLAANDEKAVAVAKDNGAVLGELVSLLVNLFDPETIVVGGIPQVLFEHMLPVVQEVNEARRVVRGASPVDICYDEDSQSTVLLGAAEMAYLLWKPQNMDKGIEYEAGY